MSADSGKITVNGKAVDVALPCNIGQFLERSGWKPTQVVVEHNGQVVPRTRVGEIGLAAGDRLEIIMPVAGG